MYTFHCFICTQIYNERQKDLAKIKADLYNESRKGLL